MSREFRMPSLGADMEAGTLVEWKIAPGARIRRGEVVALVETEKGIIDIEAFEDGLVERLVVAPGARVPVGTPLALLEGEPTGAAPGVTAPVTPSPVVPPSAAASATTPAGAAQGAPAVRASPAARARAAALGIDLQGVRGTGPQAAVTLQDVEDAAGKAAPPGTPPAARVQPARGGIRDAIAASMSRSKREIPHYYLQLAMDFQPAASWLQAYNEARPVPERVLTTVLLIKAVARAAAERPGFNGYFGAAGFESSPSVHVGVAIALRGGGLVAPALPEADRKPVTTLMRELQGLVGRVRAGHMRSSEIASATITVTSLGEEGVDVLFPIIHPPQVAIVGFGSVVERPWIAGGRVEARPVLNVTLAADHRVTDGRLGAQFLACIRDWLSRPEDL